MLPGIIPRDPEHSSFPFFLTNCSPLAAGHLSSSGKPGTVRGPHHATHPWHRNRSLFECPRPARGSEGKRPAAHTGGFDAQFSTGRCAFHVAAVFGRPALRAPSTAVDFFLLSPRTHSLGPVRRDSSPVLACFVSRGDRDEWGLSCELFTRRKRCQRE